MLRMATSGQDQAYPHNFDPDAADKGGDSSDLDWETPPIYELRGFGKYAESTITPRGKFGCQINIRSLASKLIFYL